MNYPTRAGAGPRRTLPHAWFVVAVLAALVVFPTEIESARWWHSPRVVGRLGMSPAQIQAVDEIYRDTGAERSVREAAAKAAHDRLDRVMDVDVPAEQFERAASDAAAADAARNRLRTMMLYRMYRVLTPRQRHQFDAVRHGGG